MSNAFITIQEDETHYDQIKGAEMLAFFDDKGGLRRFDVLGGANAMFFLEENGVLATVNKAESKMLSATFKDGELQRVYYFDQAKNDGYPVVQLSSDEMKLKGYNWMPEKRPADRKAVTPLSLRPSQRKSYEARPRATFLQTEKYFPGYIGDIYRQIEIRDSLRIVRQREQAVADKKAAEQASLDSIALEQSLAHKIDSLAVGDSLKASVDSLAVNDSISVAVDSAVLASVEQISPKQAAKEAKMKAREEARKVKEAKKQAKQEAREARWAELDQRDAAKLAQKEDKKREKERQRKRKALEAMERQRKRDEAVLEKYKLMYQKEKASLINR